MGILLGFLPFITFAVLSGPLGVTAALIAGAVVSAVLIIRGRLAGGSPKILEIGTVILFAALAVYAMIAGQAMSIIGVRLCVDAGLLAIVVISMLLRRPFTIQYAREQVPPKFWNNPRFVRVNYVITAAWAAVFLIMVIADAAMLYMPGLPTSIGVVVTIAALVAGVAFTKWYPKASQARAAQGNQG